MDKVFSVIINGKKQDLGLGSKNQLQIEMGARIDGSKQAVPVGVIVGKELGTRLALTGGVHGDEFEGPAAVSRIWRNTDPKKLKGVLILIPAVNLYALQEAQRDTPVDGINLNRCFPGKKGGSWSQRLADAILNFLADNCDFVLDFHSAGMDLTIAPCAMLAPGLPGSDGARKLAMYTGHQYMWEQEFPGDISSALSRRSVPAVSTEVGGEGRAREEEVALNMTAAQRVMIALNMVEKPKGYTGACGCSPVAVQGSWITAGCDGLFRSTCRMKEDVKAGSLLGEIYDLWGNVAEEIRAPHDGIVFGIRTLGVARTGQWLVLLMQRKDS